MNGSDRSVQESCQEMNKLNRYHDKSRSRTVVAVVATTQTPVAWSTVMRVRQSGFTMIELIVVIVVLGILAATALPKFIDMSSEAKSAALRGVNGASASAMMVNFSGCAVLGHTATAGKCVKVDNCEDLGSILQGGLPAGYTVAAAALGAGTPGANGVEATCTLTQTDGSATATFTGISAGN